MSLPVSANPVADRVRTIILAHLNVDDDGSPVDQTPLEDLGADSLDGIEIIMSMEEEFGIEVDEKAAAAANTVGDIIALVEQLVAAGTIMPLAAVRACRVCKCTDDHACEGGCYWIEPDLCSACGTPIAGAA